MSVIDRLFDKTYAGLTKALDLTWRRNQAIVSNIANAETPQYRAVDLDFAGELERAFQAVPSTLFKTNERHLDVGSQGGAHLVPTYSGVTKQDGNNVDIDIQMGRLAHNSGAYSTAANLLRRKLAMLKIIVRVAGV